METFVGEKLRKVQDIASFCENFIHELLSGRLVEGVGGNLHKMLNFI